VKQTVVVVAAVGLIVAITAAAYLADRTLKRKYLGIEDLERRVDALEAKP